MFHSEMTGLDGEQMDGGVLEGVIPSYYAWILVVGFVTVALAVMMILLLQSCFRDSLGVRVLPQQYAYILAVLASIQYTVMHSAIHALSPSRNDSRTGMGWNEGFFWLSLFCLLLSLPYYCSPSSFAFLTLIPDSWNKEDDAETSCDEETPLQDLKSERHDDGQAFANFVRTKEHIFCLRPRDWALVLRGSLGVMSVIFLYVGVSYLPPSQAVSLYATAPWWSMLFSTFLLGERDTLSGITVFWMGVCFTGVLLILGPWEYIGEDKWQEPRLIFLARALSLLSGVCAGIIGPLVRALPNVHVLEMLTWLGALGVAVSVTIAIFFDSMWWFFVTMRHAPITAVLFVTVLGLVPYMGRLCLNMAWQAESAATVTLVFVNVWVALQYLAQVLIMKEYMTIVPSIGIGVVFLAGSGVIVSRLLRW